MEPQSSVMNFKGRYMSINVPVCIIRMIDSLNYIPMFVALCPGRLETRNWPKATFLFILNRKENPTKRTVQMSNTITQTMRNQKNERNSQSGMKKTKTKQFNFQQELRRYCRSDKCITVASSCHLVYKANFLERDSIGGIPPHGGSRIQHIKQINIQHDRNYRERHVRPYKIDFYYRTDDGKDVALKFHGCFWYDCPKCFSKTTMNFVNDMHIGDFYAKTTGKRCFIKESGYIYIAMLECDLTLK
ncbi:hypothetical protein MAR_038506 [Mya arenaria]|uniref:C2H2-type domain-containing protein n=1 Tax=Mya arenaria TaxID=6604 RepID=A0ABY7FUV1_MYAAR|nr:hypothetical protein MAR_038506 [Mya arenaria]